MNDEIEVDDGEGREQEKPVPSTSLDADIMQRSRPVARESSVGSKSGSGDSWVASAEKLHPSRKLDLRARGYGIAAGYERPYKREAPRDRSGRDSYGSMPHSGYYGAGEARTPFKVGQAGFMEEMEWYRSQYGRETSGYGKQEKSS